MLPPWYRLSAILARILLEEDHPEKGTLIPQGLSRSLGCPWLNVYRRGLLSKQSSEVRSQRQA